MNSSPVGLHRVLEPPGVLPQAARRLDPDPRIREDEVRVRLERLNLDAASYRQLHTAHGGDPDAIRAEVLEIIRSRGKMHNPVTGSGGMLIGVVDEAGPKSPLGLRPGMRIATLVSLTLTPLRIDDDLRRWDGRSEQVPAEGHAILFARSIAAELPGDLPPELSLAVMDVCGAPALTHRVVAARTAPVVAVIGAAGKSGSLALAAARRAGAEPHHRRGPDRGRGRAPAGRRAGRRRGARRRARPDRAGRAPWGSRGADVTVVCVDVPGCEHGAILATAPGGTVVFFSMATSFSAAALGAEGLAADVTMLIGNGYAPGHAQTGARPAAHRSRAYEDLHRDVWRRDEQTGP